MGTFGSRRHARNLGICLCGQAHHRGLFRSYDSLMTQLADQRGRLLSWCDTNAPVTAAGLNPPAEPRIVRDAESATGRTWTPELREWFARHNGSDQGNVFPPGSAWSPADDSYGARRRLA